MTVTMKNFEENKTARSLLNFALILFFIFYSCNNNSVSKDSFIGTYALIKTVPANAVQVNNESNWLLKLDEKNNFHLSGPGKEIDGYWKMEANENAYQLLLQGDGTTATAKLNGDEIYFEQPTSLLNNQFSQAIFVKQNK
jgi:hypothetical protein